MSGRDGESATDSHRTVTCTRGHERHVEDLDKMGMDYFCPECHAPVASGEVTDAKYRESGRDE